MLLKVPLFEDFLYLRAVLSVGWDCVVYGRLPSHLFLRWAAGISLCGYARTQVFDRYTRAVGTGRVEGCWRGLN